MANFQGYTLPSPNGGLNVVDPIDNMPANDAQDLVNLFPNGRGVKLRGGYELYSQITEGSDLRVAMLESLPLANGTDKLIASTGGNFFDIADGAVTKITGTTTPSTGEWNATIFAHRLYMCNGVDTAQVYDGTTVSDVTFSGVTLSELVNVSSFKERLYFIRANTLELWYGNTLATGASALTKADLTYFFKEGGFLLFAGSWTNQLATTSADLFFACSSEGEILFYNGSSPAEPWSLVARFVIGKPLGYRAFIRVNNDVWILTQQGIVPISSLFSLDPEGALDTISRKINPIISQYAEQLPFSAQWSGKHWPIGRRVYIKIPITSAAVIFLVFGQDSKGWCTYDLASASDCVSLAILDGAPYIGSASGYIYSFESGLNDNDQAISFSGRCAPSFFGTRGNYKTFKDIRPLMKTKRGLTLSMAIETNFQQRVDLDTIVSTPGTFTPWGSPWGSAWSEGVTYIYDRHSTKGQGHSGAIRFQGSIQDAPLEIYGFEVRFELGGQV